MGEQPQDEVSCDGHDPGSTEQVLAAALEAYVSVGADRRVVAWNPAAEATFGYTRDQACGHPVEQLIILRGHEPRCAQAWIR